MNRELKSWILAAIRPPLAILAFILKVLYWVFVLPFEKHAGRKRQLEFAQEIKISLPFLFSEYGAQNTPNEGVPFPEPFDYITVTLEVDQVLLRFIRGRGELSVEVSPTTVPREWHGLPLVIAAVQGAGNIQRKQFYTLSDVALALKANMHQIQKSLSSAEVHQRLSDFYKYERVVTKQLETEINRRLYD